MYTLFFKSDCLFIQNIKIMEDKNAEKCVKNVDIFMRKIKHCLVFTTFGFPMIFFGLIIVIMVYVQCIELKIVGMFLANFLISIFMF